MNSKLREKSQNQKSRKFKHAKITRSTVLNQMKLTVNIQTILHVFFIRHAETTPTQVTVISGLGVHKQYLN